MERWHWIALDESFEVHRGSQPTMEGVQVASGKYPVRAYSIERETAERQLPYLRKELMKQLRKASGYSKQ